MTRSALSTLALVLVLASGSAACGQTVTRSLLISEATLATAGNEFADATAAITPLCKATPMQPPATPKFCNDFDAFGRKFKAAYPLAVQLWKIGRQTSDKTLVANESSNINALLATLATFTSQLGVK